MSYFIGVISCCLFSYAVYTDLKVREISNYVSGMFLLLAVTQGAALNYSTLLGSVGIYFALFFLWKMQKMGGGDVKLITSSSLFFSLSHQISYLLNITLAGGALSLFYLCGRNRLKILPRSEIYCGRIARIESWRIKRGWPMPYAIAIAAGFAITVWQIH